jgi:hypothetical protein
MVEAAPAAPFKVVKPNFLLKILIVALDAPAELGKVDQTREGGVLGKCREPVFSRFLLAFGPLDQQPFFRSALAALVVTPRDTNTHASKTRGQALDRAFSPFDCAPRLLNQNLRSMR